MTVIELSLFRTQIDALIAASDKEMSQINRDYQIKAAIQRYNHDVPKLEVDDVTGDGGKYYAITTELGSWVEGESRIVQIEYPAATIASDEMPIYLEDSDWQDDYWADVSGTLTRHLFLPLHAPAATETMRVSYTVPYTWAAGTTTSTIAQTSHGFSLNDALWYDDGEWKSAGNTYNILATHIASTITDANNFVATELAVDIPQHDFFAVCNLGAGLICCALATKYSRTNDSTISTDSANHPTRAQEFRQQCNRFVAMYNEHFSLGKFADQSEAPAQAFADWNTLADWPGKRRWLFHGNG